MTCECCDHPLQHAIRKALNVGENLSAKQALEELRDDLHTWEESHA